MNLHLFPADAVPSPICFYDGVCPLQGLATFGPWQGDDEGRVRTVRCLTCRCTGVIAENLTVGREKAA